VVVLNDRRRSFELRSDEVTSAAMLTRRLIDKRIPRSEQYRYDPGRGLNLDGIASAITAADFGSMVDLTDLGGKTIETDPNLLSCLDRRFGQLEACGWTLRPASGLGIDKAKAKAIADDVTKEIRLLPSPTNWGDAPPRKSAGLAPLIASLQWALWDGRASVEKVWAPVCSTPTRRVRWAIGELQWIHPRRLSFGPRRELRLVESYNRASNFAEIGMNLTDIPNKYINFTPQITREYPEREGYCRPACYFSFFKRVGNRERLILAELFSRPLKVLEVDPECRASEEELQQAEDDVEALGAATQVRLPKGVKLELPFPGPESGGIHTETIDWADRQIQILLLGQPMTSSVGPTGSRSQGEVGERQQDIYLAKDGRRFVGLLQPELIQPIVELNAAPFELENDDEIAAYCPTIEIHTESEPDRKGEVDRLNAIIDRGVPIAVEQVYEVAGLRPPEPGEEIIASTAPTAKRYDSLEALRAEEAQKKVQADQLAATMRENFGATPGTPPGAPSKAPADAPPKDGNDGTPATPDPQRQEQESPPAPGQPPIGGATDKPQLTSPIMTQGAPDPSGKLLLIAQDLENDPRVQIATLYQRRARVVVLQWLSQIADALEGRQPYEIAEAVDSIELDPEPLAKLLEESALRSAMVAAVDTAHEVGTAKRTLAMSDPTHAMDFVRAPYSKALDAFMAKEPVARETFDALSQTARRSAFTMAGAVSQDMLETVHQTLAESIAQGTDLRKFKSQLKAKFDEQGWTSPDSAHLETVFRTNTMAAAGEARFQTMTTPQAIAIRPYLQWVSTHDDRTRETHAAAHGKIMAADDPTWDEVRPPAGFNCRCTLRSLRLADAKARDGQPIKSDAPGIPDNYEIVDGSDPVWDDLPDDGFSAHLVNGYHMPRMLVAKPPTDEEQAPPPDEQLPNEPGDTDPAPPPDPEQPLDSEAEDAEEPPERGSVMDGGVSEDDLDMLSAYVVDQWFDFVSDEDGRTFGGYLEITKDGEVYCARIEALESEEDEAEETTGEIVDEADRQAADAEEKAEADDVDA
jgi:SPP1 gp7 family putative phage head morphogenesis protein